MVSKLKKKQDNVISKWSSCGEQYTCIGVILVEKAVMQEQINEVAQIWVLSWLLLLICQLDSGYKCWKLKRQMGLCVIIHSIKRFLYGFDTSLKNPLQWIQFHKSDPGTKDTSTMVKIFPFHDIVGANQR